MRIGRAALRAFELRLVTPLATAHGLISERRGWLIRIEDEVGRVGFGEATPLPDFGTEQLAECERALIDSLAAWVGPSADDDAGSASEFLQRTCHGCPTARAALDCALADLEAQREESSLARYWRRQAGMVGEPLAVVHVQALVSGTTPDEVFASAKHARRRGHRAYKLKLVASPRSRGTTADVDRVAALREAVGPDAKLRLDANEAFTLDAARLALAPLARFEIDYVEQPVPRDDLESLSRLDLEGPVHVAADEALLGDGLEKCLDRAAARILILKPAAIGGTTAAMRLLDRARESHLRIIWSSLLDGSVSRLAAIQLAAAFGEETEIHGLGTGPLLEDDFNGAPGIDAGSIRLPSTTGLGLNTRLGDRSEFDAPGSPWVGPARVFGGHR